jgi:uncharacterized protein (TIGR00730 family)
VTPRSLNGARITVYCAGSARVATDYLDGASELAQDLVDAGAILVFGGGKTGLMGHVATEVIRRGGKAAGVMPQFLKDIEMDHPLVDDFTLVAPMAERKAGLLANTEGLIALPGGCGTLEELAEAITLKRLGQYLKPVVIVNQNGFYDDLLRLLQRMVDEAFMNPEHLNLWTVVDHPRDAVAAILRTPDLSPDVIHRAAVKA